jgi:hypothetical protein
MGLLGSLLKTVVEVVELPVAAIKDVASMGGVLTDQEEPYTVQKLEDIGKDVKEVKDELTKI